jgi:hypothetical protein
MTWLVSKGRCAENRALIQLTTSVASALINQSVDKEKDKDKVQDTVKQLASLLSAKKTIDNYAPWFGGHAAMTRTDP